MTEDLSARVIDFLAAWAGDPDAIKQSFRDHLAPNVAYQNVGLTSTTDLGQAIDLIDNFMPGMTSIAVEILSIAQDGNKVLTERIDYIKGADGVTLATIRLMGIFEFEGQRIIGWRDYFDTAPFLPQP